MCNALPFDELLRPIAQVAERHTGRRPSPATCWRWLRKCCRGVKLNAVILGGQWLCSERDFAEFLRQQAAAQLGKTPDDEDVYDKLSAAGLLKAGRAWNISGSIVPPWPNQSNTTA